MLPKSLKLKVSLYLTVALSGMMLVFLGVIVHYQRAELLNAATAQVTQLSEVVAKGTRFAMLKKQSNLVNEIIQDIGKQKGIERVRVLGKDGTIASSNDPDEIGLLIDENAEPCIVCHRSDEPVDELSDEQRWRTLKSADGREMLGSIEVIRNERSCARAACHDPPEKQSVLGVVDITYSLEAVNEKLTSHIPEVILLSAGFILSVSAGVGALLHRLIYVPLKDLEKGARRVSAGELGHPIPVRGDDEFGRLAGSFNQMTEALQQSQRELEELIETLEQKVRERTRELNIAEAGVVQGEKLAAVGQLAAGIAHELNNPLTGVLTFTQLLRKKMPEGSQDADDLDLVIRETKRCASIIRRLLDFARQKVPENTLADINKVIEDTVRLVERSAALQQIEIVMDLDASLPKLLIDGDLIKQVIMNMLVNSQQAIAEKGTITIGSRLFMDKKAGDSATQLLPMVEISISDTGCGIPKENLQRIFDPFFTSKEVGKGTGLGLSVSYGIVKSYGGEIKVESAPGEGTTFRIHLPFKAPSRRDGNDSAGSSQ